MTCIQATDDALNLEQDTQPHKTTDATRAVQTESQRPFDDHRSGPFDPGLHPFDSLSGLIASSHSPDNSLRSTTQSTSRPTVSLRLSLRIDPPCPLIQN